MSGNTVLITGGSSGIGLALAERFLAAGNEVLVCGRRADALAEAQKRLPKLRTLVADTGSEASRIALHKEATALLPKLNVLINNAGIQRQIDLTKKVGGVSGGSEPWAALASEIAINVEGPIHLALLFFPHLVQQDRPVVANVTSGLAFAPLARVPVYSASKAAMHSFTQSLRYQWRSTPIEVVEIIPPAVRTNLGGSHDFGAPLGEYADSVMAQLKEGRAEVTYEFSTQSSQASRKELDEMFKRLNP